MRDSSHQDEIRVFSHKFVVKKLRDEIVALRNRAQAAEEALAELQEVATKWQCPHPQPQYDKKARLMGHVTCGKCAVCKARVATAKRKREEQGDAEQSGR